MKNELIIVNNESIKDKIFVIRNQKVMLDFHFAEISRSQFVTSIQVKGIKGGRAYLPYAFTEQGIYMLMTVLKGEKEIKKRYSHGTI